MQNHFSQSYCYCFFKNKKELRLAWRFDDSKRSNQIGGEMQTKDVKVFLGGTCNGSQWRDLLIPLLTISYYNPVIANGTWDAKHTEKENAEKEGSTIILYGLTPKSDNIYSIAEAVDDSNKRPEKTILLLMRNDEQLSFSEVQWRHIKVVADLVKQNGAKVFIDDLQGAARELNRIGDSC